MRRLAAIQAFWLIALLPPLDAAKKELAMTGSLQRITLQAVEIKRADGVLIHARLPQTAKLRAGVLTAEYKLGDQVEIVCKSTPPIWDNIAGLYHVLEVEKFKFVRFSTPDELTTALASRAWREPGNLLKPPSIAPPTLARAMEDPADSADAKRHLEKAREVALKFVANLPNFMADENAIRSTANSAPFKWKMLDVVKSDITFKGSSETRDNVFQDGKPVPGGYQEIRGLHWNGAFGAHLKPLFDPDCPVTFKFQQRLAARGRQLLVYEFSSPTDSCFSASYTESERFYAGRRGKVFIDESTGDLMQLNESSTGYPPEYRFSASDIEVIWDYVKIGDATHLLPVSADEVVHFSYDRFERIQLKYTNHRHFEASSSVTFH